VEAVAATGGAVARYALDVAATAAHARASAWIDTGMVGQWEIASWAAAAAGQEQLPVCFLRNITVGKSSGPGSHPAAASAVWRFAETDAENEASSECT
jgi:hypothetical protein